MYSLVKDDGEQQRFRNVFTGDMASIDRSAEMVELGIWFDIEYSVGGWAYLMDTINDEKYWVADMAWSKTVVRRVKPHRLFMQDRIAKKRIGMTMENFSIAKLSELWCLATLPNLPSRLFH